MTKDEFRKVGNLITSQFSDSEKVAAAEALSKKVLAYLSERSYTTLMAYYPLSDEIGTLPIINYILSQQGKRLVLPRMSKGKIIGKHVTDLDDLVESKNWGNKWGGIKTPKKSCQTVSPQEIDIVIVPGRAFDFSGNRIGRGKGHYDSFLPGLKALTIGVCYRNQLFNQVPQEPHDVTLDVMFTD